MTEYTPLQIADILTGKPERITAAVTVPRFGVCRLASIAPEFAKRSFLQKPANDPIAELASLGFSKNQVEFFMDIKAIATQHIMMQAMCRMALESDGIIAIQNVNKHKPTQDALQENLHPELLKKLQTCLRVNNITGFATAPPADVVAIDAKPKI